MAGITILERLYRSIKYLGTEVRKDLKCNRYSPRVIEVMQEQQAIEVQEYISRGGTKKLDRYLIPLILANETNDIEDYVELN